MQAGPSAEEECPDIHSLFVHYNRLYFDDALGACSVQWSSKRMTLCAGTCQYGAGMGCIIKLSEPLLKFRPCHEMKETLLHEMIHAWVFLTGIRNDGDHGPAFCRKMHAINHSKLPDCMRPEGGYNITVYHSMHEEVDHYRQHWWKCERCERVVKRVSNRPPQESDCRGRGQLRGSRCRDPGCAWHVHQRMCGGQYIKVREPDGFSSSRSKRKEPPGPESGRGSLAKPPRQELSVAELFRRAAAQKTRLQPRPAGSPCGAAAASGRGETRELDAAGSSAGAGSAGPSDAAAQPQQGRPARPAAQQASLATPQAHSGEAGAGPDSGGSCGCGPCRQLQRFVASEPVQQGLRIVGLSASEADHVLAACMSLSLHCRIAACGSTHAAAVSWRPGWTDS